MDGKIGDKHEEVMSRMGAIMAAGILDAGVACILHEPAQTDMSQLRSPLVSGHQASAALLQYAAQTQ